jgi:DnaD and phage-associated domain
MVKVVKDKRDYFVILDRGFAQNKKLSWKARGIFLYLWSQDDSWEFYETEVANHAKDGRDSLRSGLKELEDEGFLTRKRSRDENGRVKGTEWHLHETPMLENPTQEKPRLENATLISNNLNKQQQNKQEREAHAENAFEAFSKTDATLNSFTRPQLIEAIDRFGDDVVTYAINKMAEQATYPSFSFLSKKLNNYEDSGVKSVADAEAFRKKACGSC